MSRAGFKEREVWSRLSIEGWLAHLDQASDFGMGRLELAVLAAGPTSQQERARDGFPGAFRATQRLFPSPLIGSVIHSFPPEQVLLG